jgi:hypothetical protein
MATAALTEEVAANLEEAAAVTRKLNTSGLGYFFVGLGVGAAVGFYFGYRYNKEKIRAEAFAKSEEEVEKIREVYRESYVVTEPKPSAEEIVEERGYAKTEDVADAVISDTRPLPSPVPIMREPHAPTGDAKRTADGEKDKDEGWSYPRELSMRTTTHPYIIHQDEFTLNESGYPQATYSYYAGDDILADENDVVLANRETLIGVDSLNRFGHGADDLNVLYIRNPHLEIEVEVCRTPKSYEEEVEASLTGKY